MSISGLPGRREDAMRAGISTKVRGSDIGTRLEKLSELLGVVVTQAHIYGLPEHGQTDISSAAWVGTKAHIRRQSRSRERAAPNQTFKGWSLIRNGLLRTQ
jgi:hypothetical protein